MDFEICNFVDRFMPKHTLYTLTKIQKVKKHNRTPLRIVSFFFSETKVKCVQKSYHSFSDNGMNYKPSMKNVQSFRVIRFLTKIQFVPRGGVHGWVKCPPV